MCFKIQNGCFHDHGLYTWVSKWLQMKKILCNRKGSVLSLTLREQHVTVTTAPFLLTQKYNLMENLSISFAALETDKWAGLCQTVSAFHQPSTGTIISFATALFCVCAEGRFPQSEPRTGCYSASVRQSHTWSWQHVAKLMRFWLSIMGQELTSSGRPFTFFFLSFLTYFMFSCQSLTFYSKWAAYELW